VLAGGLRCAQFSAVRRCWAHRLVAWERSPQTRCASASVLSVHDLTDRCATW
jgi:hypothetical protein